MLGFSVLRICPIFGPYCFLVFALKNCGFSVKCLARLGLQIFSNLVFGFRFFFSNDSGLSDFSVQSGSHHLMGSWSNAFYSFSGFAKEVTPYSRTKTVLKGIT